MKTKRDVAIVNESFDLVSSGVSDIFDCYCRYFHRDGMRTAKSPRKMYDPEAVFERRGRRQRYPRNSRISL